MFSAEKENSQLMFAGHPVTLRKVDGDVLVHCKNVTGTYTQAKAFVNHENVTSIYQFGVKTTEPAFLENFPDGRVKIACLHDTREKFMALYDECERILGIK
jgi:hypothetical protein